MRRGAGMDWARPADLLVSTRRLIPDVGIMVEGHPTTTRWSGVFHRSLIYKGNFR
jgi:hypothetical protein